MSKAVIISRYGMGLGDFGLTEKLNVGKNACIGDIRASMAMDRVDYL